MHTVVNLDSQMGPCLTDFLYFHLLHHGPILYRFHSVFSEKVAKRKAILVSNPTFATTYYLDPLLIQLNLYALADPGFFKVDWLTQGKGPSGSHLANNKFVWRTAWTWKISTPKDLLSFNGCHKILPYLTCSHLKQVLFIVFSACPNKLQLSTRKHWTIVCSYYLLHELSKFW